jgi:hypothetical protein
MERAKHPLRIAWLCQCACGQRTIVTGDCLRGGTTKSCGCLKREEARKRREKPKPQPGERFGRLTILAFLGTDSKHPSVRCQCDCGTICEPHWGNVKRGVSRSCGCLRVEELNERATTHGASNTPEYHAWAGMLDRCRRHKNTAFKRYGGRGIRVCERWSRSFENFLADLGPRPTPTASLDRIDPNGHYEPSNCRWETRQIQRVNQRRTKLFTFNGHTGTLKDLATRAGISYSMVHQRMKTLNWTLEDAMTTPAGQPRPR